MRKELFVTLLLLASSLTVLEGEGARAPGEDALVGTSVLTFTIPDPNIEVEGDRTSVIVDGWGSSPLTGGPMLPERSYHLLLGPQDLPKVLEVATIGTNLHYLIRPVEEVPSPHTDGKGPELDLSIDRSSDIVRDLGTVDNGRSRHWVLRLSPFSVKDNILSWPDNIRVTVSTGFPGALSETEVPPDLPGPADDGYYDPQAKPLWSPAAAELPQTPEAQPSYTNRFPPVECLIITTSTYNSTLKPLADWKTKRGVPTRIIETGWISSRYSGSDTQEKIRNCIISFYNNENLKWVVLGGDHSVVPSRMAYIPDGYDDSGSDGSTVPADSYYGDIAGSGHTPYDWDGDNDGNYGEYSVDGIDLNAEVWVGRLSVSSTSNMQTLVNNILNYEKNPPSGSWYNRAVLAGAYSNYKESSSSNDTTDEATLKEAIRTDFLPSSTYNPYTLYEKGGIWPSQFSCNASLTNSNMVSAIDPGAFMVNMAGHGSSTGIYRRVWNADSNGNKLCDSGETSDHAYYTTSASQSNGGKKPLFYNDACNNGEFDRTTCLTEDILLDVGIGAVGSARVSWYSKPWAKGSDGGWYNQGHDYRFWQQFFTGSYQPGKALALSKYDYIVDKTAHDLYSWKNLLQYNLMGDPEIPIWTKTPGTLSISHSPTIPSPGSYTFTVTDGSGNPVNGAKVCLMNLTNFYGTATTGSDGKCSITLPSITQMMDLTVSARNFKPLTKTVQVGSDTERPRIVSVESLGSRTTGDSFKINALITDNVEVSSAVINYNWSDYQPAKTYNSSMYKSGPNNYSFMNKHPTDRVTKFWYRVGARDVKGNWNHSSWYSFEVTDNDLPELVLDNSMLQATTGDIFIFEVHIRDNIGTGQAHVNYTLGSGPSQNLSMTGPVDTRAASIMIPSNLIGPMSFIFYFNDISGNLNKSSIRYRTIIDDDAPVLISDNSILPPTTGDAFIVNVSIWDNIGLLSVRLVHLIGGRSWMNQSMQLGADGNYTGQITIPPSVDTNITYRIFAVDPSGNAMVTPDRWLDILDNDLPYMMMDTSDLKATTGETFNISLRASDNIGVEKVTIEYTLGGSDIEVLSALHDPSTDRWYGLVEIPSDAFGNVSYRFDISDMAANHLFTEVRSVNIMDNDLPVFISDRSDEEALTGYIFNFRIIIMENVDMGSVIAKIQLQPNSYDVELELLDKGAGGLFVFSKDWSAPYDLIGNLTYSFVMTDSAGNENSSRTFTVVLRDGLLPTCELLFENMFTTGDDIIFHANATDNIGISSLTAAILMVGGSSVVNVTMRKVDHWGWTGPPNIWAGNITMPDDVSGELSIRAFCTDAGGNLLVTEWQKVMLVDNDAPSLIILSAPKKVGTGSDPSVLMGGNDNIGITDANALVLEGPMSVRDVISHPNGSFEVRLTAATHSVGISRLRLLLGDGVQWTNGTITMEVYDDDPPAVEIGPIPSKYGLNTQIAIEASVSDNLGVDDVILTVLSGETQLSSTSLGVDGGKVSYLFEATAPMDLTFDITVKDGAGNIASARVSTKVVDDKAPEIKLKKAPARSEVGKRVVLDASPTMDASRDLNFTWRVTAPDGTTFILYGSKASFVPDQKGTYKVTLTVTDPAGNKAEESFDIAVDGNGPLIDQTLIVYIAIGILLLFLGAVFLFFLMRSRKKEPMEENGYEDWDEE